MKNPAMCLFMAFYIIISANVNAQEIIDLGKCNLKITESREIESFKSNKGSTVKPSRRDAKLIELRVDGKTYMKGESAWYPQMFAAMFYYRGSLRITPGIAVGIKFTDPLSGEKKEQWFNEPGVSYTAKHEEGDNIGTWVVVEIAKETKDFILQGPAVIPPIK